MAASASVICVLGMHRSGTSLATRALHSLGVPLGPEHHLMKPRDDNPLGFFEHQALTDLNDEILWRLGGCWHTPPAFQMGWAESTNLEDLRVRARTLVADDFGALECWAWKDPRNCLTLPFWQPLLPPMRYIVTLRSPLDVARSLAARDGFSIDRGLRLWLAYVESALAHSSGRPRLFVSYDALVERPLSELSRIAAFVGRPLTADSQPSDSTKLADIALRHHAATLAGTLDDPALPFPIKALHVALWLHHDQQRLADRLGTAAELDEYSDALNRCASQAAAAAASMLEREANEEALRGSLRDAGAAAEAAATEAAALHQAARGEIAALQHARASVEAALVSTRDSLSDVRRRLADANDSAAQLRADLEDSRARLEAVELEQSTLLQRFHHLHTFTGLMKTAAHVLLPTSLSTRLRHVYNRGSQVGR